MPLLTHKSLQSLPRSDPFILIELWRHHYQLQPYFKHFRKTKRKTAVNIDRIIPFGGHYYNLRILLLHRYPKRTSRIVLNEYIIQETKSNASGTTSGTTSSTTSGIAIGDCTYSNKNKHHTFWWAYRELISYLAYTCNASSNAHSNLNLNENHTSDASWRYTRPGHHNRSSICVLHFNKPSSDNSFTREAIETILWRDKRTWRHHHFTFGRAI